MEFVEGTVIKTCLYCGALHPQFKLNEIDNTDKFCSRCSALHDEEDRFLKWAEELPEKEELQKDVLKRRLERLGIKKNG